MSPLSITHSTSVSATGHGRRALLDALLNGRSGLRRNDFEGGQPVTWIGRVEGIEQVTLPQPLARFDCRNNRLAELALHQDGFLEAVERLKRRHPPHRIALFIGTSTSGIHATERAYREQGGEGPLPPDYHYRNSHDLFSVTDYLRRRLGLNGPAHTISTACSSSAKVFADAQRFITAGLCDAAVVGGVDSLCLTTLYGFHGLELVSSTPCRPGDRHRDGITIGEAAGLMILEPAHQGEGAVSLLGYGESSDAHHMSTPHPEGLGAAAAMAAALDSAGVDAEAIDYINLHGTATPSNDRAEDQALQRLFATPPPCSSTKGWTGHTLGAAGITEAVIAALTIEQGLLPATLNCREPDPSLAIQPLLESRRAPVHRVLSNSFGFGGSNCSLLFGTSR